MRILIETIPHERNRNGQVGDYQFMPDGTLYITVSEMGNANMEWLVALHEMIEQHLALNDGITEEQITAWDEFYEKKREMNLVDINSEDGFATDCIYKKYHTIATGIELILAAQLKVDWIEYDQKVNSL
jgi:hypothetical protein